MGEGRRRDDWARTAEILAMLANVNRDKKHRHSPYTSAEFNPTLRRKVLKFPKEKDLSALKAMFLGKNSPKGKGKP